MARRAAECLVRKKFEQEERELTKEEHELGECLALKYYPNEVLGFLVVYADYVGYYSGVYVKCENLPSKRIDTSMKLPTNKNEVRVNIKEYEAVCAVLDKWKKLREKKAATTDYLMEEIMKLRTYKRVAEQAPELLPFLPEAKEEKKLPAVNYGNLRAFVKSIVETKRV